MPDTTTPSGEPPFPAATPFPSAAERRPASRGCLKWGLIGCAGLSIVVIVGLVFAATKLKSFVDTELTRKGQELVSRAEAEVTAEEKAAFQTAYRGFVERVKDGKVPFGKIQGVSTRTDAALADGAVTPEELRELTSTIESAR